MQEFQPPIAGIRTTIHVPRVRRAVERVLSRIQAVDPDAHARITARLWGIFWLTEEFREVWEDPDDVVWGRTLIFPAQALNSYHSLYASALPKVPPEVRERAAAALQALREGPLDISAIGLAKSVSRFFGLQAGTPVAGCWMLLSPYAVHLRSRFLRALIAHEFGHVATTPKEISGVELQDLPLMLEKCANSYVERWFLAISDILTECLRVGLLVEEPESLFFLYPEKFDALKALRGRPHDWPPKLRRYITEFNRHIRQALRDYWRAT